jgi:hypothetical protein
MIRDALRQDFISAADRAAMERGIAYYRRRAAGAAREKFKAGADVNDFCERHGFSLDWLFANQRSRLNPQSLTSCELGGERSPARTKPGRPVN